MIKRDERQERRFEAYINKWIAGFARSCYQDPVERASALEECHPCSRHGLALGPLLVGYRRAVVHAARCVSTGKSRLHYAFPSRFWMTLGRNSRSGGISPVLHVCHGRTSYVCMWSCVCVSAVYYVSYIIYGDWIIRLFERTVRMHHPWDFTTIETMMDPFW